MDVSRQMVRDCMGTCSLTFLLLLWLLLIFCSAGLAVRRRQ
jgi:hypothetical protein